MSTRIRAIDDLVELRLGGATVDIYEDYEVTRSILRQPSAFKCRLGWGRVAAELKTRFKPKTKFELLCEGHPLMTGELDAADLSGPPTVVELSGRDYLAPLFDSYIEDELSFSEKSYLEITNRALKAVGLESATLFSDNTANRKVQSGLRTNQPKVELVEVLDLDTGDTHEIARSSSTPRLVHQTIKAELGQTWDEFLRRQYRLAGLFLWADANGDFVLTRPNGKQTPSYTLIHQRTGEARRANNVQSYRLSDDRTNRHERALVYGRTGGGKHGRSKVKGEFIDAEMAADGYTKRVVFKDEDLRNDTEGSYAARRHIGEERRAGWKLEYTVAGHTTLDQQGNRVVWAPDTVVQVEDVELGLSGRYYLEAVTFNRSNESTSTRLELMRTTDLVFAESLSV